MFLKASLLVFMVCVGCVYTKQPQLQIHRVMKQANQPKSTRISCINTYISQNVHQNVGECLDVSAKINSWYTSSDILASIALGLSSFTTFCNPTCGIVIVNAWRICNVYKDAKQVTNLLLGLCASDKGTACYRNYTQLIAYYNNGRSCYDQVISRNICTSSCSTALRDGAVRYGCCVNPPISFNRGDNQANVLFSACGVTQPSNCTNSPLTPSGPAVISNVPTFTSNVPAATCSVPAATKLGTAVFVILVIIHLLIF